jgi:Leucine-rich repeat (LRR) protein
MCCRRLIQVGSLLSVVILLLAYFIVQVQKELEDISTKNKFSASKNETLENENEIQAMYELNKLRPPNMQFVDKNPCLWGGIACKNGHIRFISWWASHLSGMLPSSIGNLKMAENIGFAFNNLSGSLPTSISKLQHLNTLHLGGNRFSGDIPPSWGNISTLEYLGLETNQLSGGIPESFAQLMRLKYLGLNDNRLVGPVPALSSTLYACYLENNKDLCWGPNSHPLTCRSNTFLFFFGSPEIRSCSASS